MKNLHGWIALTAFCLSAPSTAAPINQTSYTALTGTQVVTFDDLPGGDAPGVNYNNLVTSNGVGLGEHFVGQTVGANGVYDTLSGTPTGPLTLVAGAAGQNLNIFNFSTNVLTGLGNVGYPADSAIGEGAFSVLFSTDQSQFGFQLVGGDAGTANVSFFRQDGSLIQAITLTGLANAYYGFSRDGGVQDIRGISITNQDPGGIGFDNLKFDVASNLQIPSVPEPSSWLLFIAGFGLAGAMMRRRVARASFS